MPPLKRQHYPAKVNTVYCRVGSKFEVSTTILKLCAGLEAFTRRKTQIRTTGGKLLFTFTPAKKG